jgi:hypothetical protein
MSTRTGFWEQIASFGALCRAARRAALGKRRVAGVARWLADLEPNALRLERELQAGTWRPGRPTTFVIHDPKTRTITAAPFEDRVVHHALMDALEPLLERRMLYESFACRRGKGTHAALCHARRELRRHGWFLKLDIERCFESIGHDVALACLARVVREPRALGLAERIVRAGGREKRGLPIGNLSSQWLANLVLDRVDHFVKEELRAPGYVRYMDDFVLFAGDKAALAGWHRDLAGFLEKRLGLRIKERATILAPARQGLPFLGWRLYRGTVRLRPENLRRTRARLARRAWEHRTGRIDDARLAASVASVMEHLGRSVGLRRRLCAGIVALFDAPAPSDRVRAQGAANRVNRGGSFDNAASNARSANRNDNTPSNADTNLGVRPAKATHRPIAAAAGAPRFAGAGSAAPCP